MAKLSWDIVKTKRRKAGDQDDDKDLFGLYVAYDYQGRWEADIKGADFVIDTKSEVEDDGQLSLSTKKDFFGITPIKVTVKCNEEEKENCKFFAVVEAVTRVKFNGNCEDNTSAGLSLSCLLALDDKPVLSENFTFENRKEKLADVKLDKTGKIDVTVGLGDGSQFDGTSDGKPIIIKPTAKINAGKTTIAKTTVAATAKSSMRNSSIHLHNYKRVVPVDCGDKIIKLQTDIIFAHNLSVYISDKDKLEGNTPDTNFLKFNWTFVINTTVKQVTLKKICAENEKELEEKIKKLYEKIEKPQKSKEEKKKEEDKKESKKKNDKKTDKKKNNKKDKK